MSNDELLTLFKSELNEDVLKFKLLLDEESLEGLKNFAHKYKVRLHYLGYQDYYESCELMEQYYKDGMNDQLIERANALYAGLLAIHKTI